MKNNDSLISSTLWLKGIELPSENRLEVPLFIYVGPKEIVSLKKSGLHLEKALRFGWLDIIAKPLLLALRFFNKYLGNYGLSIIVLTIIIKILFWPLAAKSYKSMKEMQRIQPRIAQIRERFKNNKEQLNREVMQLYKTHKVNPMGGCLPMILQIPVFFALYYTLLGAIELRHAPFFFWIMDLSAKDPYYITPLIMGASMFLQQKMTPSAADPLQAKIMLLMPVFFTFLFLNFASGLVIYWLVNNILSIGQQLYINKYTA
jgi:YidC/Oxa1 family membrane protein insertase